MLDYPFLSFSTPFTVTLLLILKQEMDGDGEWGRVETQDPRWGMGQRGRIPEASREGKRSRHILFFPRLANPHLSLPLIHVGLSQTPVDTRLFQRGVSMTRSGKRCVVSMAPVPSLYNVRLPDFTTSLPPLRDPPSLYLHSWKGRRTVSRVQVMFTKLS